MKLSKPKIKWSWIHTWMQSFFCIVFLQVACAFPFWGHEGLSERLVVVVLRSPIHANEPSEYNGMLYRTSNRVLNNGIKVIILICMDGTSQYHHHRKIGIKRLPKNNATPWVGKSLTSRALHTHDKWFYWTFKNALHECFTAEWWHWVWMENYTAAHVLKKKMLAV